MMKKLIYIILIYPVILWAVPRDPNPTTPSAIYQNDLDLLSQINTLLPKRGTTTNDDACAGCIGEYMEAKSPTAANFPATTVYGDANSLSLTAGDWDINFQLDATRNTATWTRFDIGISSFATTDSSALDSGDNFRINNFASSSTTPEGVTAEIVGYRISLAADDVFYGKVRADFSAGQPQFTYRLSGRRVR